MDELQKDFKIKMMYLQQLQMIVLQLLLRTAAKKPATYSLKSRKPKPIITAIAAKIFFIFISLMLFDKGTTTNNKIAYKNL